jgi:hypothetical protein
MHSRTRVEDCPAMVSPYPLWNEYWDGKQAKHARTQVPAYVVASWNSRLHSRGSLEGFKQLGSRDKWLRIHDGWEWPDYYTPENVEDLRKFFDRYLKGVHNGWEQTTRVRIDIMDQPASEPSRTYRAESERLPRARATRRPSDAPCARMSAARCGIAPAHHATEGSAAYDHVRSGYRATA